MGVGDRRGLARVMQRGRACQECLWDGIWLPCCRRTGGIGHAGGLLGAGQGCQRGAGLAPLRAQCVPCEGLFAGEAGLPRCDPCARIGVLADARECDRHLQGKDAKSLPGKPPGIGRMPIVPSRESWHPCRLGDPGESASQGARCEGAGGPRPRGGGVMGPLRRPRRRSRPRRRAVERAIVALVLHEWRSALRRRRQRRRE